MSPPVTPTPEGAGMDAPTEAPSAAIQVPVSSPAAALKQTMTPVGSSNLPAPANRPPTRDELLTLINTIRPGATRAEVVAKLGKPAYAIAMSESGTFTERCRFRAGSENLASIEFRDGIVAKVSRLAP
jgi:hypothetical protein